MPVGQASAPAREDRVRVERLPSVHAIPRLSPAMLAVRSAKERVDAHDGSWRVYLLSLIVMFAAIVALACLSFRTYPIRAVYELILPHDVVGAAATLAVFCAAVHTLVSHHRATNKSSIAATCVVCAWLVLAIGLPMLLIAVLVSRFGLSA